LIDLKSLQNDTDLLTRYKETRSLSNGYINEIFELDNVRRSVIHELETKKSEKNKKNNEIKERIKNKQNYNTIHDDIINLNCEIKKLENESISLQYKLNQELLNLPNIPDQSVNIGINEEENEVIKVYGEKPKFNFKPKDHIELGKLNNFLDFNRASKIAQSSFPLLTGMGAKLERILSNYMLDCHTENNAFKEINPPFLVNEDSLTSSGQLPKFSEDLFKIEGKDLWLLPTSEVALCNMFRNEILNKDELPLRYTSHTPCFRNESGSYGKESRGLIRQYQFGKVELFTFCKPENSWNELDKILYHAESILQGLNLPYRIISLCTGDLGFSSSKTYDIEVWFPSLKKYVEVSSCSNCTDFQSRRANIRFKRNKKTEYVHTLNGSGLAIGRIIAAILENNQRKNGEIHLPQIIKEYNEGLEGKFSEGFDDGFSFGRSWGNNFIPGGEEY